MRLKLIDKEWLKRTQDLEWEPIKLEGEEQGHRFHLCRSLSSKQLIAQERGAFL